MLCKSCGTEEAAYRHPSVAAGLCKFCSILDAQMRPPSVRTVQEYFDEGVSMGKQAYLLNGPTIMQSLDDIHPHRVADGGPILEPADLDALDRGFRSGLIRANRSAYGLPEVCEYSKCGAGFVCGPCRRFRNRNY